MTTVGFVEIPKPSEYGAVEIKEFIRKNTYKAFIITLISLLLLFLLYWGVGKATEKGPALLKAPISKIALTGPTQQTDQVEEAPPPPPSETIIDVATAAKAGTPVPVPDADIKEELKEFANVDELAQSLSKEKGTVVDFDQVQNIDLGEKKVEISGKIEEVPGIDDFIPVEKEPVVDLGELQRRIIYPEMARKAGIEGKVIVRVLVGKDGKPMKSVVQNSDSQMLDQAAKDAVMKSIFTPAIQNGQPITCWVSIPITFKLR